MKRGDIVTVALQGAHGKPRPALVVQTDSLSTSETLLICPLTSDLAFGSPHRMRLEPSDTNGLKNVSLVMVDNVQAAPVIRCDKVIGRINDEQQRLIDASLLFVFGLD